MLLYPLGRSFFTHTSRWNGSADIRTEVRSQLGGSSSSCCGELEHHESYHCLSPAGDSYLDSWSLTNLTPLLFSLSLAMTSPGPTIKSFHKHLYTVLPRVPQVTTSGSKNAVASQSPPCPPSCLGRPPFPHHHRGAHMISRSFFPVLPLTSTFTEFITSSKLSSVLLCRSLCQTLTTYSSSAVPAELVPVMRSPLGLACLWGQ